MLGGKTDHLARQFGVRSLLLESIFEADQYARLRKWDASSIEVAKPRRKWRPLPLARISCMTAAAAPAFVPLSWKPGSGRSKLMHHGASAFAWRRT
jgi:hypothetical protein